MRQLLILIAFILAGTSAAADTVQLENGGKVEGTVVKETGAKVLVCLQHGMVELEKKDIKDIVKSRIDEEEEKYSAARLPKWQTCIKIAVRQDWGSRLRQIPATVIDQGVFNDVPYLSFSSGNFELNIYGDPELPVGIELGVKKDSVRSVAAKRSCRDFMMAVVREKEDKEVLKSLDLDESKKERDGLTFEVTPTTADDAYGGWWISVYDASELENSRATAAERRAITVTRDKIKDADKRVARNNPDHSAWAPIDLSDIPSRSKSNSGSVYVKGYTRKNGTYVAPYTRSAPKKRK
jgi:hypothetical protein